MGDQHMGSLALGGCLPGAWGRRSGDSTLGGHGKGDRMKIGECTECNILGSLVAGVRASGGRKRLEVIWRGGTPVWIGLGGAARGKQHGLSRRGPDKGLSSLHWRGRPGGGRTGVWAGPREAGVCTLHGSWPWQGAASWCGIVSVCFVKESGLETGGSEDQGVCGGHELTRYYRRVGGTSRAPQQLRRLPAEGPRCPVV